MMDRITFSEVIARQKEVYICFTAPLDPKLDVNDRFSAQNNA